MPDVKQMAQLCALVGHLNRFKLVQGGVSGDSNHTTEHHAMAKTHTYEDSEPISEVVTRTIGFVLLEASVEAEIFKTTLHECERRLVQRIGVLQPAFPDIGSVSVITTEEPPTSWILRLLRACDPGAYNQISS